jgi:hypothetical protein
MKDFQWALALTGTQLDLEDAIALFGEESDPSVHVVGVQEGGGSITILTSPQMDALGDAHQVHDVANRLLSLVNGARFVRDPDSKPLIGGLRKRRDGAWDQYISASFAGTGRARIEAVVMRVDGEPPTQPAPARRWVAAAQSDQVVADVLTYLSGEPDWFDLYKAFEMMRRDIKKQIRGKHRRKDVGWPKKRDLDHFTRSAQVYRHAPPWNGDYTPENAMTLIDARPFVQTLTKIWLTWRLS